MKITLGGVSGVILVQARDCSEGTMKQWRNIGRLVKYLMCEYACTQFDNVIKFKNIKKFIENLRWLSTTRYSLLLDILEMVQISFNLLKKNVATSQRVFLFTNTAFYDTFARACAEIKNSVLRRFVVFLKKKHHREKASSRRAILSRIHTSNFNVTNTFDRVDGRANQRLVRQ